MNTKILVRFILFAVLVVSVCSLIVMRVKIDKKNTEIAKINEDIVEQKLRNNEMKDILSEQNKDDFYRDVAEKYLNYGYGKEKIYIDVTGEN